MWILDGEKLREYWDQIARGFQKSPLEVAINITLIGLIIIVPIVIYIITSRRGRAKSRGAAIERFHAAISARALEPGEREALSVLGSALSADPARWVDVLSKPSSFNAAAARVGDRLDDALLGRLRFKLGYRSAGANLHSTVELETGTHLILRSAGVELDGRVVAVGPDGFDVTLAGGGKVRSKVTLQIPRPTGLFQAETTVVAAKGGKIRLRHVEVDERVQNRQYLRRRVRGTVGLSLVNGKTIKATLIDLSGGGARLETPAETLRVGQDVTLLLGTQDGSKLSIPSRVIRLTPKTFSITFQEISEIDRDRLIRRLGP